MSDDITVITNHQPRLIIDAYELTEREREEFDYLDWPAIERGEESASFIRYRGVTYDLGEFSTTSNMSDCTPLRKWHGYHSDSFFSGVLLKYAEDSDYVVMGRYYS